MSPASPTSEGRFELIPAIDLLGGECVRLTQGRYDAATVYEKDPGVAAARFAAHAIARLHTVDLDGAKAGKPSNTDAIRKIVSAAGDIPVQLGGGIRTLEAVENALGLGVDRVILGTIALRDPALVRRAAKRFAGHVAVGIDARDGLVAVEGWLDTSTTTAIDVARCFEDAGVSALIHTDIARDGTLEGPNLESTAQLADSVSIPVIVSGGVSSDDDVVAAAQLADRGVVGVIVGRALYTGGVRLERVLGRIGCS